MTRRPASIRLDGLSLCRIAHHLEVTHRAVATPVAAYVATLPKAPPASPHDRQHPLSAVELDELYTFEGQKPRAYLIKPVDRATHCIIAYDVAYDRELERLQALLNVVPAAHQ